MFSYPLFLYCKLNDLFSPASSYFCECIALLQEQGSYALHEATF